MLVGSLADNFDLVSLLYTIVQRNARDVPFPHLFLSLSLPLVQSLIVYTGVLDFVWKEYGSLLAMTNHYKLFAGCNPGWSF